MTLLSTDSFTRANSTNNPGSTDGAGTFDPAPWTVANGTIGILSNQLYASGVGGQDLGLVWIDFRMQDIDISVTRAAAHVGVLLRLLDGNNFVMFGDMFGTGCGLYKDVASSITLIASAGGTTANGDVFRCVAVANQYYCYQNGSLIFTAQDSFLEHQTKHGATVIGFNTGKMSSFSASTVSTPHTYPPYAGSGMSVASQPWSF